MADATAACIGGILGCIGPATVYAHALLCGPAAAKSESGTGLKVNSIKAKVRTGLSLDPSGAMPTQPAGVISFFGGMVSGTSAAIGTLATHTLAGGVVVGAISAGVFAGLAAKDVMRRKIWVRQGNFH
mmetsp:Transcript_131760/g.256614  ORF Transcript_131760/g.256614 Transcript_131760/m.256614 type:complete len:128 (-) Transcript_131760:67-450(-)